MGKGHAAALLCLKGKEEGGSCPTSASVDALQPDCLLVLPAG